MLRLWLYSVSLHVWQAFEDPLGSKYVGSEYETVVYVMVVQSSQYV